MIKLIKRAVAVVAVALLPLGLVALPSSAASTATVTTTDNAVSPSTVGTITQSATCEDAGNVQYKVTLKWSYFYTDANGAKRASAGPLTINRLSDADDADVDYRLRVYSYHLSDSKLHRIQNSIVDGAGLLDGNDTVTRNPKNPLHRPGKSLVLITGLGTDGDGLGAGTCSRLEFFEPNGLDSKADIQAL